MEDVYPARHRDSVLGSRNRPIVLAARHGHQSVYLRLRAKARREFEPLLELLAVPGSPRVVDARPVTDPQHGFGFEIKGEPPLGGIDL